MLMSFLTIQTTITSFISIVTCLLLIVQSSYLFFILLFSWQIISMVSAIFIYSYYYCIISPKYKSPSFLTILPVTYSQRTSVFNYSSTKKQFFFNCTLSSLAGIRSISIATKRNKQKNLNIYNLLFKKATPAFNIPTPPIKNNFKVSNLIFETTVQTFKIPTDQQQVFHSIQIAPSQELTPLPVVEEFVDTRTYPYSYPRTLTEEFWEDFFTGPWPFVYSILTNP